MVGAWGLGYVTRDLRSAAPAGVERRTLAFANYTTPYVECAGWPAEEQHIKEARVRIEQYIAAEWERDQGLVVAAYARDLMDGAWIGIAHDEKFMAASLLKVPVLFYLLSVLEDDPAALDRTLVFPGAEHMPSPDNTQALPPEQRLAAGTAYTRRELLERMLAYSDNHAKDLLMEGVPWSAVATLMTALNIEIDYSAGEPRISVREMATLFRMLYNSSVFSRPVSELGLSLLAHTQFPNGFARYAPEGTVVASKFGLYAGQVDGVPSTQVHECGIIYHPLRPVVACVMTSSATRTQQNLTEVVATVARLIQEEVAEG